jgi:hypothetical protein
MEQAQVCDNCAMEYDWTGVDVGNYHYCCEACSHGEECTCPQHNHEGAGAETQQPMQAT